METLQTALYYNQVPESWNRLTYPSTNTLAQWYTDFVNMFFFNLFSLFGRMSGCLFQYGVFLNITLHYARFSDVLSQCRELDTWTQDFVPPAVVWLSGLFSPQSFLTGKHVAHSHTHTHTFVFLPL